MYHTKGNNKLIHFSRVQVNFSLDQHKMVHVDDKPMLQCNSKVLVKQRNCSRFVFGIANNSQIC